MEGDFTHVNTQKIVTHYSINRSLSRAEDLGREDSFSSRISPDGIPLQDLEDGPGDALRIDLWVVLRAAAMCAKKSSFSISLSGFPLGLQPS